MRNFFTRTIPSVMLCTHLYKSSLAFVPKCNPVKTEDVMKLREFINKHHQLCILTGAGISTESGIPDYRSAEVGLYARSDRRPVLYKEFCDSERTRRRYWARNFVGWPRFSSLKPNVTHIVLQDLEYLEKELNPSMIATTQMIRPDGDVELSQEQVEGFNVPACGNCGGVLKPDIVFFGDNVPHDIVQNVKANVENLDALLILGTSLSTFSAYRIVLQAINANKPIAIINIGKTRADELVNLKVEGRCGDILPKVWQCQIPNSLMR
ncbi:NAD-dependent protein deacylase Sirt4 isoform X2 [Odontomachus brunneus]|uniref:NAD-dependent protein deacylase Sirt4 isoform X2 n=1 Tax=Odontomachus brunneus TaxID=486640 RepID=UPI0013F25949|nr:NAD-dependent protein deacylase Sirt4 isoform X2 [Odontomachus brunneus]